MVKQALLAASLCLPVSHALAAAREPTGVWFTEDKAGVVQITHCGEALCGIIVGLTPSPQGELPRDFQGKPQCHRTLLSNLRLEDDERWHGTVTNPEDGRAYSAEVWVAPDGNMRLRGYIGLPLLGSTQIWPPFDGHLQPDCHKS